MVPSIAMYNGVRQIIIITPLRVFFFFTPALADGFSQELEWQQGFSSL